MEKSGIFKRPDCPDYPIHDYTLLYRKVIYKKSSTQLVKKLRKLSTGLLRPKEVF